MGNVLFNDNSVQSLPIEDMVALIISQQQEEERRRQAYEAETGRMSEGAGIIKAGLPNVSQYLPDELPELPELQKGDETISNLFGLPSSPFRSSQKGSAQSSEPQGPPAPTEKQAAIRKLLTAEPGQSSFDVNSGDEFQNTRGSFSKAPAGSSDAASKRFEDFITGLAGQKQREVLANVDRQIVKLGNNKEDPDAPTRVAQLLEGRSKVETSRGGDITSLLKGQNLLLKNEQLQEQMKESKGKPAREWLSSKVKDFTITGDEEAFFQQYLDSNPDATVGELAALITEAKSSDTAGKNKLKETNITKFFSKKLNPNG